MVQSFKYRSSAYFAPSAQYPVRHTRFLVAVALLAVAPIAATPALAAPPKVTSLFPAGGQRGQTVAITATGDFSTWPVQVWADRAGVTATAEKDKGKLKVEIAPEAIPGTYWLRLYNADGAGTLRPFIVGTLPEVAENETNDLPEKPQTAPSRVVINGKLAKSGDVDGYRVELKPGQTLVASLVGNSILGAPMDAAMQVCEIVEKASGRPGTDAQRRSPPDSAGAQSSAQDHREADASRSPGKTEAFVVAQNHDACGLDPLIAFTAPKGGAYLVRLFALPAQPDSSVRFAGGEDYLYRLTLTTGPYIDHALPLAAASTETSVEFGGWNLGAVTSTVLPPLTAEADPLTPPDGGLVWAWHRDGAGAFPLPRVAGRLRVPSSFEASISESDGTRGVPTTSGGCLESSGAVHTHPFAASKGQKIRIRVAAKALGFPTDATIAVLDRSGKVLAEADDNGRDDRDPTLEFMPPEDGQYAVRIGDLARRGGVRMCYRLTIEPVTPDFTLSLAADSFVLEKGKPLEIPVNVAARDSFKGPIEITAVGLPPGVTVEPLKFEPSGNAPPPMTSGRRGGKSKGGGQGGGGQAAKLVLKAEGDVMAGGAAIRIEGRTGGDAPLIRSARFSLNLPLAGQHHAAWLTVK